VKMDDGLITLRGASVWNWTSFLRRSLENTIHQRPCLNRPTTNTTKKATRSNGPTVGSRRSLIVSLILTIAIAFGSLVATLSLGWGPKLGLDLAGGLSVVYKPATHASTADMQEVSPF